MWHIAGPPVRARGLVVQRCAWCGEALVNQPDLEGVVTWSEGEPTDGRIAVSEDAPMEDSCMSQ